MKVMRIVLSVFVLGCFISSVSIGAVVIKPDNLVLPTSPGGLLSFDLTIDDPAGVAAVSLQTTINVSGPGTLTFDVASSEVVESNTDYWVYNNSIGAAAIDRGSNNYEFGDGADNPSSEVLVAGEIVARYAFTWDGTEGDYTFTLNLDPTKSSILNDATWEEEAMGFTLGDQTGGSDYFTVHVPEPATMILFGLGGLLLRKRRA